MAKQKINVGMVGYAFMGKAHSVGYRDVAWAFPDVKAIPVMKELCGRNESAVKEAAELFGWERYGTDYNKLVTSPDIDLVDIGTGNDTHKDIALEAAAAGKHIFCEKPLARNVAEAKEMADAVTKAGVIHMVNFNYRVVPAVALAKKMIDEGMIGTPYHFRAVYLQDWIMDPNFPLVWRLDKSKAGSGSHGDLNAHIIDLARYLCGEFDSVCGLMKTFIEKRPLLETQAGGLAAAQGSTKMGDVTVDDATLFLAKFANGAIGTFEATRFAGGGKNGLRFELNGSEGTIRFNLERLNEIEYYSMKDKPEYQGFKNIMVTDGSQPYAGAWWPGGHIIGWQHTFVHQVYNLMNGIVDNKLPTPNFIDGLKCQEVLEAVEKSAEGEKWVKI